MAFKMFVKNENFQRKLIISLTQPRKFNHKELTILLSKCCFACICLTTEVSINKTSQNEFVNRNQRLKLKRTGNNAIEFSEIDIATLTNTVSII